MSGTSRYDIDIVANNKASRALGNVTKQLGNIEKGANKANNSFNKMKSLAVAAGAALGSMKLAQSFMQTATQFENLNVQLKFITGNARDGAKALGIVEAAAANSAFAMEDMAAAAPSLLTVSSVEELASTLDMAGDIAAATGMGFQEAAGQLQRAFSGGIAAADIFREKGVKSMLGFQEGVKYTAEQTEKMIRDAFANGTTSLKGATAEMAKTWDGQISMMGDAWTQFKKKTMDSGLFEELKLALAGVQRFINENKEAIDKMAAAIGDTLGKGVRKLGEAVAFVATHSDFFLTVAKGLVAVKLAPYLVLAAKKMRLLNLAMMANPIGAVVGSIALLITYFVGKNGLGRTIVQVQTAFDILGDALSRFGKFLKEKLVAVVNFFKGKIDAMKQGLINAYNAIAGFIPGMKAFEEKIKEGASVLQDKFTASLDYAGTKVGDFGDKLAENMPDGLIDWVDDSAQAILDAGDAYDESQAKVKAFADEQRRLLDMERAMSSYGPRNPEITNGSNTGGTLAKTADELKKIAKETKFYEDAIFRAATAGDRHIKNIGGQVQSLNQLFDELNPVTKQTREYQQQIKQLNYMIENNIGDTQRWKILLGQIKNEMAALVEPLDTQANRFTSFFDNLITSSKDGAEQLVFVEMAAQKAMEMLEAGLISIDAYAQVMVNLGKGTSEAGKEIEKFSEFWEGLSAKLFPVETKMKSLEEQIGKLTAEMTKNGDPTGQLGKAVGILKEELRLLDPEVQKQIKANALIVASMQGYKDKVMRVAEAQAREKEAMDKLVIANNKLYASLHPVETQMAILQSQIDGVNKQLDAGVGNTEELTRVLLLLQKQMREIDPALAAQRELVASLQGYDDAILRHKRIVESNNKAKARAMIAEKDFKEEMRGLLDTLFPAQAALTAHQQQILDIEKAYKLGEYTLTEYNAAIAKSNELFKESQDDGFSAELQSVTENLKPLNRAIRENEETLATLKRGLDSTALSTEQYNELVDLQAKKFAEATKKMKTASEEFVDGFNKDFNDTFADALVEGNLSFDTFADLWKGTLKDLIKDTLNQGTLLNDILGGFGKGAGGGGFNFSSIFSGGGADGIGNLGFVGDVFGGIGKAFGLFADGGHIKAGQTGIVGEAGPELVTGPATVTSNEDSFGGNAPPVNITIQAIDTQTGTEFLLKNKRQIEGIVQSAYNRRGKQGIY